MRSNEWNPYNSYQGDSGKKWPSKEHLCPNLSPFAIVSCYSSPCVLHKLTLTPLPFLDSLSSILSSLYLNAFFCLCLSFHLVPHFFFLNPFSSSPSRHLAPSKPMYRQSLMHYRHSHQSWFCFTAERSRLSFWLHINCSVGTQTRIVKYLPIFSSPLILYSTIIWPSISSASHIISSPHFLLSFTLSSKSFFLLSFLSIALSCPLLWHHISLWYKLPTVGLTWTLFAETGIL